MKIVNHTRTFLLLAAIMPTVVAFAQNEAKPVSEEVYVLGEFRVNTAKDDGFVATESTSGTRVAADIINLPFAISVLTEDFIKEFKLYDLDQQVPFISGMAAGDPASGGGGGTRLRGFSVPYFRNGFARTQAPDSNSIARTEVIKGPQSAIYGRVSPGGVINFISKKPGTRFSGGLNYVTGSYDHQRVSGDITGPIIPGKLFYRVDATYYDLKRSTDFWYNRTTNLSGAVAYKLSPDTQLTFEYEYANRIMQGGTGYLRWSRVSGAQTITEDSVLYMPDHVLGDRLARYAVNGALNVVKRRSDSSYLTLEHRISPDLNLRANFAYTTRGFLKDGTSTPATWMTNPTVSRQNVLNTLIGTWLDTTRGIWAGDRAGAYQRIDYVEKGFQIDLTKKWNTAIKQRTLLTFDTYFNNNDQATGALSGTALNTALNGLGFTTTAQLNAWKNPDPFNPAVSGYFLIPRFNPATWTITGTTFNERFYYGSLLNHTVELMNGRLFWTGSVREDWGKFTVGSTDGKKEKFTYSTGLNYHVVNRLLVAYGNIATGFNPAPQFDANTGELLGNQGSFGGEVGLKGLLLSERLSYTLAAFNVEQDNQVTDNPANPGGLDLALPRSIPGASTRSRGLNLDVAGKVTNNLTLLANISWTDVRIVKHATDRSLIGTRPLGGQNVPVRTYSLAARYNFREGLLGGLRLGLTYQYAAKHLRIGGTATATAITVPYYSQEVDEWSAVVGYAVKKFKNGMRLDFSLNVTNLLDNKDISLAAYYPEGRTMLFTTGLRF